MSDNKVAEFMEVTHTSDREAQTYLSKSNGDLEMAVASYMEEQAEPTSGSRSALRSSSVSRSMSSSSSRSSLHRAPRHRFATFSDLTRAEEVRDAVAPNSDDPAQFFTGGERSGLAVTNPNDRRSTSSRSDAGSLVDEILRKAQQRASEGDVPSSEDSSDSPNYPQARFSGKGFRLGSDTDNEQALVDDDDSENDNAHDFESNDDTDQPILQRTMYFWRDGFSIDDGPLYRFDDPRNAIYLRAINMGRAPIELLKVNPHQPVDVKLVQKPDEDYTKPKLPPSLENSGPGQRLGSAATAPYSRAPVVSAVSQPPAVTSQPATSLGTEGDAAVQLRLSNGTTRRLRFNAQGPVQQLYDYINFFQLHDGREYVLQTPLPPRKLEDKQQSLESAGVVGAVVVQRWI